MKTKRMCVGCEKNIYNEPNRLGCFLYQHARVVLRRRVPVLAAPPYDNHPVQQILHCRHETGYIYLTPEEGTHDTGRSRTRHGQRRKREGRG